MVNSRIFNLIYGTIGLILCMPLFPIIILLIKLESPGPAIFRQLRVGKDNRRFWIYKFRTMIHDTDNHNPNAWSVANDPRITKIGKILRDTWLDETLQFFNVLKGDMNIIGPRPELPYFVELFSRHLPNYNLRHTVRPGLTGLSQVLGFSGDTCILLRFKKDIEYIHKKSEKLDRRILLYTLKKLLSGIPLSPIRCSDCQFKDDARSRWICFDVRHSYANTGSPRESSLQKNAA